MARDLKDIGVRLEEQRLLVARDYMTHEQHERWHAKEARGHEG
jgi:hypothetical protein